MKKILFIVPTITQTNGVAAFIINYLKYMEKPSFEVEVIYSNLRPSKYYEEFFLKNNIKTHQLPYVRDVELRRYCKAIKLFFDNNHDYDLIYSNVSYQTYFFYIFAKKYGMKNFAIHSHATKSSDNKIKKIFGNILQKKVNKICKHKFACSKLAGEAMFMNDEFTVINNAINYDKYKFDNENRNYIRSKMKISEETKVVGFVGRFTPQKNVFFFIDLIKKLSSEYKILMIGDGQQKKEFLKIVKDNDLENRFLFVNETNKVNLFYSAFDYFLLPSLYEGLPVVGVEAQANGLPCLLSNTISTECKISNNVVYLDKNNVNEWVDKIRVMYRVDNIKLDDEFNINVQAKYFENILEKI